MDYKYRPASDFYYLSGFKYPNAVFVLIPDAEKSFILFVKPKSAAVSQWFGDLPGIEGAMETFGADTAYAMEEFENVLPQYAVGKKRLYFDIRNVDLYNTLQASLRRLRSGAPQEMVNVMSLVHELRLIKGPEELRLLRRTIDITGDGLIEVMKAAEPGMVEYELDAIFDYVFRKNGCPRKGFPSIVGSGKQSTIFHYEDNDRKISDGDIVVMDVGAEYGYYSADITRTIPINGKFSKQQKAIYEIVLKAQKAAIKELMPGKPCFGGMKISEKIAKEGLYKLGLITDLESNWQHWLYYYPFINHGLGLDTHDVGDYGDIFQGGRNLEPGMVLTVEPGIYIGDNLIAAFRNTAMHYLKASEEDVNAFLKEIKPVFDQYKPLGTRIEDDILITETGNENLSKKVPRTVKDIEKMMKKRSYLNQ